MGNPGSPCEQTMIDPSPQCYIPSFVEIGPLVLEKRIWKGFYHTLAWRPSWSSDTDAASKLSFPLPIKDPQKIGFDRPCGFREEDVWTLLHVERGKTKCVVRLT